MKDTLQRTVRCPLCGKPYKFFPWRTDDQSACPKCVAEAEKNMGWR